MKTYKMITAGVMCLIMGSAYGQYGSLGYPHTNSFLTSAKKTTISSTGFVMAGVFPNASAPTQEDFLIQKTDANGNLASGFTRYFNITSDPSCTNSIQYASHKCLGVDVVETSVTGSMRYAISGLFDGGIFFATLNANGNVIQQYYWPTGLGAQRFRPTVRESQSTPGVFYICGHSASKGYAIRVNTNTSTVDWSKWYTNLQLEPKGIIESPYNPNEVIIIGRCDVQSPGNSAEAFFLRVDKNSGVPVTGLRCYSDGLTGDEWFNSIELANSSTGGSGFILGGHVHSSNQALNGYTPWMIKLGPTGNVIWSTLVRHTEQIVDVIERYNTVATPPKYEYFGISRANPFATSTNSMRVWKLNDVGAAAASPNCFIYGIGSTSIANDYTYAQIESVGNGPNLGDGFAAFGTEVSANRHVLIKAYYNGINGCDVSTNMVITSGPGIASTQVLNHTSFVPQCAYFSLNPVQASGSYASTCSFGWTTFPGLGSNARESVATGLNDNSGAEGLVSVYPNPTKGIFAVEMNTNLEPVTIKLSNSLGQLVKSIEVPANLTDTQKIWIDFNELGLSEGLYFLNIHVQNQTLTKKVTFTK